MTNRYRLKPNEITILKDLRRPKVNRLVIGDIHLPYTHPKYLEHCQSIAELYNCSVFPALAFRTLIIATGKSS